MTHFSFQYNPSMTILYDTTRKKEPPLPASQFSTERELCLKYFDQWSEQDQIQFVENLLSRMCHYQHGHINTYLKPMLQRDFISLLPSMWYYFYTNSLLECTCFSFSQYIEEARDIIRYYLGRGSYVLFQLNSWKYIPIFVIIKLVVGICILQEICFSFLFLNPHV